MPSHEKDLTAEERWHVIIIFTLSVNVLELQRLMNIFDLKGVLLYLMFCNKWRWLR